MRFSSGIADAVLGEARRQAEAYQAQMARDEQAAQALYEQCTPVQRRLLDDPFRWVAARVPRRGGKSFVALAKAIRTCLLNPGATVPIVTLTLKSAKRIYWRVIQQWNQYFGLGLKTKSTEYEVYFPNGSFMFLMGAESRAEIEKLRGDSFDGVVLDECKSFAPVILEELLDDVIIPALGDREGWLLMIGTPGTILSGPFYEATEPEAPNEHGDYVCKPLGATDPYWEDNEPEWSFHTWTRKDNTAIRHPDSCPRKHEPYGHLWCEALAIKRRKRWSDDNPTWMREYLGEWVPSDDAMVYAYSRLVALDRANGVEPRCVWNRTSRMAKDNYGLPEGHNWHFVLGLDLGYDPDPTTFVVSAYSTTDHVLYPVWDYKANHLKVHQIGSIIEQILQRFPVESMVGDTGALGTMIVESINDQFGFWIEPAEKKFKLDFIELLNSDLHDGKILIDPESDLALEMQLLQWDVSKDSLANLAKLGKLREHRDCPNDLCDAFLYTWRYCYHHFASPVSAPPAPGSPEAKRQALKKAVEKTMERKRLEAESEWWQDLADDSALNLDGYDPFGELGDFFD